MKRWVLVLSGVVAAAVGAGATYLVMRNDDPSPPATVQVVLVTQDIRPGDTFTTDMLRTVTVPPDQVVPNAVTSPGQIVGLKAGEVIYQNQQVPSTAVISGVP